MQILILTLVLIGIAVIATRSFFISEFKRYHDEINTAELEEKILILYHENQEAIPKSDIQPLLSNINQIELATEMFERELTLYSTFIILFIVLIIFTIFLIFFTMITKPLKLLQEGTKKVANGDLSIRVKQAPLSPINNLIISFNTMIGELESSRDKLIAAEKEMIWRQMAHVMAHEIKNPLTPIRLSAQRLEQRHAEKNENFDQILAESLEIIYEETDILESLVRAFSDFAKMPQAKTSQYDLNQQILEVIEPYKENADIRLHLDPNLPVFTADKMQIRQMLVNLLQNAIDAIQNHGKIDILTSYQNFQFIIIIEDNGKGIAKEDLPQIFDPYFSKKEKGVGLGLAIVKRIVEQHQGAISVQSIEEKGTKFTIKINRKEQ
jgi:nitrogen fixation/metabolism regulation signal transduction histidine kinase